MSIHHPLGFNWHALEGPGTSILLCIRQISTVKLTNSYSCPVENRNHLPTINFRKLAVSFREEMSSPGRNITQKRQVELQLLMIFLNSYMGDVENPPPKLMRLEPRNSPSIFWFDCQVSFKDLDTFLTKQRHRFSFQELDLLKLKPLYLPKNDASK